MAIDVMSWVWRSSKSQNAARLVLLAIADCARSDGSHAYPSIAELQRKANLKSDRSVQDAIKALVKLGELVVEYNAGPKGCNLYRVVMSPTPAESAGAQNLRGVSAEPAAPRKVKVSMRTPAKSAGPRKICPPQISTPTPAESAPGTVIEPSVKTTDSLRESAAPESKPAKPSKHETADALAAKFWEIHKSSTAQPFLAIRGVIRTAIANGIERDDVARALDRLAREGRAISGGTLTTALGQIRGTPATPPFRRPSNDSGLAAAMQRALAAEAAQANHQPARKELTA